MPLVKVIKIFTDVKINIKFDSEMNNPYHLRSPPKSWSNASMKPKKRLMNETILLPIETSWEFRICSITKSSLIPQTLRSCVIYVAMTKIIVTNKYIDLLLNLTSFCYPPNRCAFLRASERFQVFVPRCSNKKS